MTRLDDVLDYWSAVAPSATAVRFQGRDITWGELDDRVRLAAGRLQGLGVDRSSRVAILLENRPEFFDHLLAVHRLGGVVVPINVRLAPAEIPHLLLHGDVTAFVTSSRFADHAQVARGLLDARSTIDIDTPTGTPEDAARRTPTEPGNPVALLCFTSGTTGAAKGVELTHDGIVAGALKIMLSDRLGSTDRSLLALPQCFTGSLAVIWSSIFLAGGTLVLEADFDAERTLAALAAERATVFYGVPFLYQEMARTAGFPNTDLTALRVARVGAAPVSAPVVASWIAKGVALSEGYGLTEGGAANLQVPLGQHHRLGTAGLPLLGGRTRIVDDEGRDVGVGEAGELLLQGPEIMRGYYRDAAATEAALAGGWLHTGDLARRDGQGWITIVGRRSDMIISGGLNVYPAEVEAVARQCADVLDVAVFGIPDPRWGETVAAVVVAAEGCGVDSERVVAHCRTGLGDYKVPRRVVVQTTPLPRNASGKVLTHQLADLVPVAAS